MKKLTTSLIILCLTHCILAQTRPVIKNLVFEGAGIRGIAYAGVISGLESQNMLRPVQKVGGTSAGAIVALTISLGYTGKEIGEIISSTDFRKFNDGHYFFVGGINRINKYFGWYRGKKFEKWLRDIIEVKTRNADISFEELHKRGFKDLYVTGTCLNKQQLIIFSHETFPKMKVRDAVRISASIPLYFEAVFIDNSGSVIKHPKRKAGLDIMVDGGFTGNFPIKMFDSTGGANHQTLGFRIDSEEQVESDRNMKMLAPMMIGNFKEYMAAFYNIVIENLNRQQLTEEDWKRTVSISDGKVGPRVRKLSSQEIQTLIDNGRDAVESYFISK